MFACVCKRGGGDPRAGLDLMLKKTDKRQDRTDENEVEMADWDTRDGLWDGDDAETQQQGGCIRACARCEGQGRGGAVR